jgi:hypothetical protein
MHPHFVLNDVAEAAGLECINLRYLSTLARSGLNIKIVGGKSEETVPG